MSDTATQAALEALKARGISDPDSLLGLASPAVIVDTCRWFDDQTGAGSGLLVATLRKGGMPGYNRGTSTSTGRLPMLEREKQYGERIVRWLDQHFPDLERHPAAVAEVIRLHYRHGKQGLPPDIHGPDIRDAVKAWEREFNEEGS